MMNYKLKDKYYDTLTFLISKGECITKLTGKDSDSVDKNILNNLHREKLINVSYQNGYSDIIYFESLSVSLKGYDFVSQYEKDNEFWYKKVLRWENLKRGMELTKFFGWVIIFLTGFLSGKYFG
ncbi:hypothetical protein ACM9HF_16225 [Colwellia sp. RE-S-Sl-9]